MIPGTIEFFAHGLPKGQPRARAFAIKGKVRMYDPGTAEGWKSAVAEAARPYINAFAVGPVRLTIVFEFPRPKSHKRKNGDLRPDRPIFHTAKPDCDNAAKALMDALTQIGVWTDDAQVAELCVTKKYADGATGAGVWMRRLEVTE